MTEARAPLVKGRLANATRVANVLDGHACFGLLEEADDLFIGESRLLHVRHSPEVDGLCAIQLVRPRGSRSGGLYFSWSEILSWCVSAASHRHN